jgi:hypothetical protein
MERYFTLETESRRQFFQVPKQFMMRESKYYKMTSDSKLLYGILADRNSLSISNGWVDEAKRVYFIATIESLMELTGWGNQKVTKHLKELRKYDLLISVAKGQGNPSWHYLLQIDVEEGLETQLYQQKCENHISRNVKITSQGMLKSHANNTNNNKTNINNTDILSSSTEEVEEEDKNLEDLKTIMSFCNNVNFKIKTIEIERLLVTYSLDKIIKAINSAISSSKQIENPYGYLTAILNNMEQPKNIVIENKTATSTKGKLSEPNFTQREYDYEKLEKQLLGWEVPVAETEESIPDTEVVEAETEIADTESNTDLFSFLEDKIAEVALKTWIIPNFRVTAKEIILTTTDTFIKNIIAKRYLEFIQEFASKTGKTVVMG